MKKKPAAKKTGKSGNAKPKKEIVLVEKHDYLRGSAEYAELDALCFLAKNLYNATLYRTRHLFFEGCGVSTFGTMVHELALNQDMDYQELPAKVAQHVVKLVYDAWKSYFALVKLKQRGRYEEKVRIPKYLKKKSGRQSLNYTKQAVSVKDGFITLSKTALRIKTKVEDVQFVRVTPKADLITVEVGYKRAVPKPKKAHKFSAIDIGQDNLAAVVFQDAKPYIINGRPIKSVNHTFNKRNAGLTSLREKKNPKNKRWTRQQVGISRKRSNRISDYFHKASRFLIDDLVERGVTDLIVGHNDGWKQNIDIGKKNNQTFVNIPFNTFISDLAYKGMLAGIRVHVIEESYTSQASFLDRDFIPTFGDDNPKKFSGSRVKRGLYRSAQRRRINADVNGALNIFRKFFQNKGEDAGEFSDDCCASPKILSFGSTRDKNGSHTRKRKESWERVREARRKRFVARTSDGKVYPKHFFLACV